MGYRGMWHIGNGGTGVQGAGVWGTCMGNEVQGYGAHGQWDIGYGAHRQSGTGAMGHIGNGTQSAMGTWANRAHGAIVYSGYGVQGYRPHGKWAMRHMDNGAHGAIVYRGYGVQGV